MCTFRGSPSIGISSRPSTDSNGRFQTSALQELDLVLNAFPLLGIRRCILLLADDRPFLGEFGVELLEVFLTRRDFFLGIDGLDRALGLAQRAIDALIGIDDQKVRALVETIDRTNLDTVHVFALDAAFGDHERHDLPFSCSVNYESYSATAAKSAGGVACPIHRVDRLFNSVK